MKYFFDTEFIEAGPKHPIQLLSIGIVSEDGREFYGEVNRNIIDWSLASQWVLDNVVPLLSYGGATPKLGPGEGSASPLHVGSRESLGLKIRDWVGFDTSPPEFWAWYADYDWVVLCQSFGTMMDLPKGWPMYCHDLKQEVDRNFGGIELPKQEGNEHNALADARWVRDAYNRLHG